MSEQAQYPDILGMLTRQRAVIADVLQCALGVFPVATALDKPVEALLLLQNMTNRPLPLTLLIRPPLHDTQGNLANFFTPRPRTVLSLPPGECGLLHIPITPQLPTCPALGYPVEIQVQVEKPANFLQVRSPSGGPEPNMLALSPFRLAVLRDINFASELTGGDTLRVTFDVLPGRFGPSPEVTMPRFESLWSVHDLSQEEDAIKAVTGEALRFAHAQTPAAAFPVLLERTQTLYAAAGLPLHPGEAHFIAKGLSYTLIQGLELEEGFSLLQSGWFRRLCRLFVTGSDALNNLDQVLHLVYTALAHDAVLLGFHMVSGEVGADFGDGNEQREYAARLVAALEGRETLGMEHVYVPLVMAGVIVHVRLTLPDEKPWRSLERLKEARDGRVSLAGAGYDEVFGILNRLIERNEGLLEQAKVKRR